MVDIGWVIVAEKDLSSYSTLSQRGGAAEEYIRGHASLVNTFSIDILLYDA